MNARYSIRREPQGLSLPFGAGGVAAIGAVALGMVGLLVPIAWLETISFQLYLDNISSLAQPPLGMTAKIIAAVALALFGALLGYVLAKAFGVTASDFSFTDVIARLRGTGAEDEEDAPDLRAIDRHPDAPARRPFSAARDIPAQGWDDGEWGAGPELADDDADELVLDAQFEPVAETADDDLLLVMPATGKTDPPIELDDPAPLAWGQAHESIEDYDLQPPDPSDWEIAENVQVDGAATPTVELVDEVEPMEEAVTARPARAPVAPLDLSAARLDELIARLESGLNRRAQPVQRTSAIDMETSIMTGEPASPIEGSVGVDSDPAFPHDPALAAALATLRKMNARVG